jgi:hypothetical protein
VLGYRLHGLQVRATRVDPVTGTPDFDTRPPAAY